MNIRPIHPRLLFCAAALALATAMAFPTWAAGPLDGKVFVGEAGVKGKAADERNDVITFVDGKFHSSACDQWGFGKGDYTARVDGDATHFEVTTTSEREGQLVWKGTLKDGVLEGTFVHLRKPAWYRPSPDPIEHWFKAVPKS